MYNNWLNWWYNTVNIKSLNIFSLNNNPENEPELSNNHFIRNIRKYISGLIVLSLFALLYFLFYDGLFPGNGETPSTSSVNPTSASNISESVSNAASTSTPSAATDQVQVTNNKTEPVPPVNDAVAEMNRRWNTGFRVRPLNPPRYVAPTRVTSWPTWSFNRFNVLDQLNQDRPGSPTGSTDSSETITPANVLTRTLDSVSDRAGDNDHQDQ